MLEKLLNLKALDYSFESLKKIDKSLRNTGVTFDFYFENLYYWLVPYTSQCIINEKKATWDLKYNEKEHVIEPLVKLEDGRSINLFTDLNDDALENFNIISIHSIAQRRLATL